MLDRQPECKACCPQLVKRRRALLESNPPRNSQLKLIEADEGNAGLLATDKIYDSYHVRVLCVGLLHAAPLRPGGLVLNLFSRARGLLPEIFFVDGTATHEKRHHS